MVSAERPFAAVGPPQPGRSPSAPGRALAPLASAGIKKGVTTLPRQAFVAQPFSYASGGGRLARARVFGRIAAPTGLTMGR